MFNPALNTRHKICKQTKLPSMNDWIKKKCSIYLKQGTITQLKKRKKIFFLKRGNFAICNNMDRPGGYYTSEIRQKKANTV